MVKYGIMNIDIANLKNFHVPQIKVLLHKSVGESKHNVENMCFFQSQ
jgi:hypothetical protein